MDDRVSSALHNAAQDLSKADAFALGPLAVDPPARRIGAGTRSAMLEPRVMRVLVALGETPGKVLSRDDLIALAWDGMIVGDKAIDRAISLLRHALDDLTGGAVRLETITKVGFRLVVDGQPSGGVPSGSLQFSAATTIGADYPVWRRRWSRRAMALGLAGAGAGAVLAYAGWFRPRRHVPDPRAVELYRRGQAIQKAGVFEAMGEAIALYKQAVAIDPRYADAWAGIAIGHRYPVIGPNVPLSDTRELRVAAGRALALDPDSAEARLALIVAYPLFHRWLEREARLRAFVGDHPDSALGHALLAQLLLEVGRLEDALAAARRAVEIDPLRQIGWIMQVNALSLAGRINEADLAFEEARSRWPRDRRMVILGYIVLFDSRRYAEAAAYLRDATRRPGAFPSALVGFLIRRAEMLASGRGIAELRNWARNSPAAPNIAGVGLVAPYFVLIGMVDEAFALLEAYFFGGVVNGTRIAPPGPLDPRPSYVLFEPAVLTLRSDPRFASLLERTGLEDYWRKSGTQPDFRRG
jgi:DNA-binding winged helix-turn-helix (wHTH) protein/tetratricopeptide (TPR) repeat protein